MECAESRSRKLERERKKFMSKYGKFLIEYEESNNCKVFTRMRYVSQEEFYAVSRVYQLFGMDWRVASVLNDTRTVSQIFGPGYYRVDKIHQPLVPFFRSSCMEGFPMDRSRYWKSFERQLEKNERVEKYYREENQRYLAEKQYNEAKIYKKAKIAVNRRKDRFFNRSARITKDERAAQMFFSTMALTGEINKKMGGCR